MPKPKLQSWLAEPVGGSGRWSEDPHYHLGAKPSASFREPSARFRQRSACFRQLPRTFRQFPRPAFRRQLLLAIVLPVTQKLLTRNYMEFHAWSVKWLSKCVGPSAAQCVKVELSTNSGGSVKIICRNRFSDMSMFSTLTWKTLSSEMYFF